MRQWILFMLFFLFIIPLVSGSDHPVFIPESDSFRPVYSTNLSGPVSPDHPLRIDVDIRDSETGFVRVYAWGENGTEWKLNGMEGTKSFIASDPYEQNLTGYPKVITLKNITSEYLVLDPGLYPLFFESDNLSGTAEVLVVYVYHEQIDMGLIKNQAQSIWETTLPEGLERAVFMTESALGTDLNLYIQKGKTLPSSFSDFDYHSTDNCTTCWDPGIENYISEIIQIDNPEPGPYLMVTKADGGDDFFFSYWIGIEKKDK